MSDWDAPFESDLDDWQDRGLERKLRPLDHSSGLRVQLGGREMLNLASNNYLGLANHPAVKAAAIAAIERVGLGAGASRLVTGNFPEHTDLERELADWQAADDVVLFDSGYAANLGLITALAGRQDLILSDERNHASLIDGCRLSRATVRVYQHNDVEHARTLLHDRNHFRRAFLITDGVFSMDGDCAPLTALCRAAGDFEAAVIVDDAHGTGVMGPEGRGLVAALGVGDQVIARMGTLSKALGSAGAFIAGSETLCRYLRNRARTFMYSTAPPPAVAAGARAAVRLVRSGDDLRSQLNANAAWLRQVFCHLSVDAPAGETPIIPIILGDSAAATRLSDRLLAAGLMIPAIRYPTVPENRARLRVTASAAMGDNEREWVTRAIDSLS